MPIISPDEAEDDIVTALPKLEAGNPAAAS
jgi:hypothetical protein